MLSYLHGFHAGNHADVLKHAVYLHLLEHLLRKEKPFTCIDTHAGSGSYDLRDDRSLRNREHEAGVERLEPAAGLPPLLAAYRALVDAHDEALAGPRAEGERLRCYPGSPAIAACLLRPDDPLHLFELHPAEEQALAASTEQQRRRRTHVHHADGLVGLTGLLPPPSRRGLVVIDPPYERDEEYALVPQALRRAVERFATGTYLLWYPVVDRARADALAKAVAATAAALERCEFLRAELRIRPDAPGHGMTGSGVLVLNPAWTLHDALAEALPVLAERVATPYGGFTLERG